MAASRLAATVAAAVIVGMRAIGRDEVHDRGRVLQVQREVGPARVGVELGVAVRGLLELPARLVQRRDAGVAAAGDVERREVERDAEELVAQHIGDELVDLAADLAGHAAHDGAGRLRRGSLPVSSTPKASGFRKASNRSMLSRVAVRIDLSTVSRSMEWPKR